MIIFFSHLILTNIIISFLVSFFVMFLNILNFKFLVVYLISFLGGILFLFFIPFFYSDYYERRIDFILYLFPILGSVILIGLIKFSERNKNDL
ncbi:hypothetical protein [Borreliella garinii]|uniref:hypothetical protein n=1 Tax=Borreliella garinii TaxID=29519 RepID=UPI00018E25D3|nr:hypothetical protein [Borreliella garinii]EED30136.1 conserved hypothetical protein [Borreliella garinii Far04]WNZ66365.1 hypothetical protein PT139_00610 [Borreliella garinii]WNZ67361.1 hypothetical protein PT135_00610 [Borreliella garinii]WNZ68358.1 hypothetical protein PT138_00610 [Borreliella garinii]WNZ69358.1 hypothetical protein PT140_00610 [Borreliella garinii]